MRCEDFPNALQRPSLLFPTQSFFNALKASLGTSRRWHKADKELHRTTVDSELLDLRWWLKQHKQYSQKRLTLYHIFTWSPC
jgi:hypothetical protein